MSKEKQPPSTEALDRAIYLQYHGHHSWAVVPRFEIAQELDRFAAQAVAAANERIEYDHESHGCPSVGQDVAAARNPCAKIFDHKWLDPNCVENGCQSLQAERAKPAASDLREQAIGVVQEIERIGYRYSQLSRIEFDRLRQEVIAAALAEARKKAIKQCAKIASNACLVPPDGGAPTDDEREVCEEAERRILALL